MLGIRREDKNRWERRVALTPQHVQKLVSLGVQVMVQPSKIRCFADCEYEQAGAIIQEDLAPCDIIYAIKEVPSHLLLPNKDYVYFSHTIKAQPYNMPMLDVILEKNIRLFDYERIVDSSGGRLVRFGPFAGYAGTIDTLHATGDRLLALGYSTPFVHVSYSQYYSSLDAAMSAVSTVGEEIRRVGIHRDLCPFVMTITGTGSVSTGVQKILNLLPVKYVKPSELPALFASAEVDTHTVYVTVATAEHMVEPIDPSKSFDKIDYYQNPQQYRPVFHERVFPYTRVLFNGMYWDQRFPRLITTEQARQLSAKGQLRCVSVGEISCDPRGPIEFFMRGTTIDEPVYLYDVEDEVLTVGTMGKGILFLAVDHLPAEFPVEASTFFGDNLFPFIEKMVRCNHQATFEEATASGDLPTEILRACIAANGKLTPGYQYITKLRERHEKKNRILLLGSGYVVQPVVDYLMRFPKNVLTVGSIMLNDSQAVCKQYGSRAIAQYADVTDRAQMDTLVQAHDIVISLVPANLHCPVAEACITHKRHMVTASYISPEMRALHDKAAEAGVTILNELGLDPGIDHLAALKIIGDAEAEGGKIISYKSWCGALPAPEFSDNPLGYKFSWSPRGVLVAAQASSKFLWNSELVEVPGSFKSDVASDLNIFPGFAFESVPNRDSVQYGPMYGLKDVKTLFRATLRYRGHNLVVRGLSSLGLLDPTSRPDLASSSASPSSAPPPTCWLDLMRSLFGTNTSTADEIRASLRDRLITSFTEREKAVKTQVNRVFCLQQTLPSLSQARAASLLAASAAETPDSGHIEMEAERVLSAIDWLGLLTDSQMVELRGSVMDCLCAVLEKKLKYEENERDVVVLHHDFEIEFEGGSRRKQVTATLVAYGETKHDVAHHGADRRPYSATAKTVGFPVGVVAQMLSEGRLSTTRGVVSPMDAHRNDSTFCSDVLSKLRELHIDMAEQTKNL